MRRKVTQPAPKHRKRSQAKKPRTCYFARLPPELLLKIFLLLDKPTPAILVLNRAFHPTAIEAVYSDAQIFSRAMLQMSCAALAVKPELATKVKSFGLSGRDDPKLCDNEDAEWESDSSDDDGLLTSLSGMGLEDSRYNPRRFRANTELVKSRLKRLVNLDELILFGKRYFKPVVHPDFLGEGVFQKLHTVTLSLCHDERYNEEDDSKLCHRLSLLPAVKHVHLWGGGEAMPLDNLNLDPAKSLPPRTWDLDSFYFHEKPEVDSSLVHLFRSFQPGFRLFKLQTMRCYPAFAADLAYLPDTLEILDLSFGMACFKDMSGPLPLVDEKLHKLQCINFGYHCKLTGTGLLSLIEGSNKLPQIVTLSAHLCACPTPKRERAGDLRPRPRWLPGLKRVDVEKLVEVGRREGVKIGGNLECAVGVCDARDGHGCSMAK
ncbi:hypothetical protein JCM8097_002742 [Rhodosporidiobolus ruineniae]